MSTSDALSIALLTISDSRDEASDRSGHWLAEQLQRAGHHLYEKRIVVDDKYRIRAQVAAWIADSAVQVVITTGGTGFTGRDATPEAVSVLFDSHIEGFGEAFRYYSLQEIGSSTIQSRALAGLSNNTAVFCLPGSTGACRTAWDKLIGEQLDAQHRPCNFASLLLTGHHPHG
ncbi:molybdenum cofactor biosynthesis protein B [Carnimonas bestiolae]|uniref:molybdenum cofactor biosynthesis protein B n=1 Tax=Carnimonas bestiolae TaxID=3402172 RepID=UPI003EDC0B70